MLFKKEASKMGSSNHGWLQSRFHFSFADYYNPENMEFGVLRVLNDDIIAANQGFDLHPHNDMEIITYVVNGELTHKDSLGNERTLTRGHVLAMSAGVGIEHSEYNHSDKDLRILQLWVKPNAPALKPHYNDFKYKWKLHANAWHEIVSSEIGEAEVRINQDISINILTLEAGNTEGYAVDSDRQAYLIQVEGSSRINDVQMNQGDGLEIIGEDLELTASTNSHFLLIEVPRVS
ncbi:pirin family protein [Mollicutes bacterium LVI A0039]|nr:pirin family protein [Mollicutes bacterium LVI A0039]